MVNLLRFETNPFDDEENISLGNFHQFATDHLNRLVGGNPGGVFAAIIADTQAAYTQFDIVYGSKSIEDALKKGATINLGLNVEGILVAARTLEKQVSFLFGKGSPLYISFFPNGLNELNKAGKDAWPAILTRLKAATLTNTVALGGTVAADWAAFQAGYASATAGQVTKKGAVDQLRMQLLIDRKALARQMFINLHTIVIAFVDSPGIVTAYFDQSIVDRKQNSNTDGKGLLRFRVTNAGGTPLINASVAVYDQSAQLIERGTTDDDGYCKSSSLAVAFYDVTFSHPGYLTQTWQYQVFDNNDPLYEVKLNSE